MPRLSAWFVRCALAYLALGFTFGALMLFEKGVPVYPALLRLLPAHIEFVIFGWTVQLAMGIAFWILPRFGGTSRQAGDLPPRGNEKAAWLALGLLNAGIWLVVLGAALDLAPILLLLGRASEAMAAVAFAVHAWPRIKPMRS
jgi:cbb3-type cytochrome oxidase subunit 1